MNNVREGSRPKMFLDCFFDFSSRGSQPFFLLMWLQFSLSAVLCVWLLLSVWTWQANSNSAGSGGAVRTFTRQQLWQYRGQDGAPVYLAVKGIKTPRSLCSRVLPVFVAFALTLCLSRRPRLRRFEQPTRLRTWWFVQQVCGSRRISCVQRSVLYRGVLARGTHCR